MALKIDVSEDERENIKKCVKAGVYKELLARGLITMREEEALVGRLYIAKGR